MGKSRNVFKKIGDIKGIFHERMDMIKDRNSKDLKKKQKTLTGGKYTEKLLMI